MIDLSKLGGPSAAPAAAASAAPVQALPDLPDLPTFTQPTNPNEASGHNWVWDQLGRAVFGDADHVDAQGKHGGLLGDIPVVSDIARAPGAILRGISDAGGVGISEGVVKPLSYVASRLPSTQHLTDAYGLGDPAASQVDATASKYGPSGEGAVSLLHDLQTENGGGNMSAQFLKFGQWQQKNDPEAFKDWQATLAAAQKEEAGGHAAEMISNYMRKWGVTYSDLTSTGVQGLYDVMPELAFGSEGSFGQGFADGLAHLMVLQHKAERGAAFLSGNQGGLAGTASSLINGRASSGHPELGARLDQLLAIPEKQRTEVENAAVAGMTDHGWTAQHAMNFLESHGQGYSSEGVTQLALTFALDPITVAASGAGLASSISGRVAQYAATDASASRIAATYKGIARAIGTTVADVRDSSLGPAFKVARTVVDPFSALPGPNGMAKVDVFAAAGLKGYEKGMGAGAVSNVLARAKGWGAAEIVDNALGVSAMNMARKWVGASHIDSLVKAGQTGVRRVIGEDLIQELGANAPKDAVSRLADFTMRHREYWISDLGVDALAERVAKTVGQPISVVRDAVKAMGRDEQAVWHNLSYSKAWADFKNAASTVTDWGKLAGKEEDLALLNPHELDNVTAGFILDDVANGKTLAEKIKTWNEAAAKYTLIESLGKVQNGGKAMLERRVNALDRIIQDGGLHTALEIGEEKALPQAMKDMLTAWTDANGLPMWKVGFKPKAQQASGLIYDVNGEIMARYAPSIENVADAIPKAVGRPQPLTDALGRTIPQAVKDSKVVRAAGKAMDSLDIAMRTATDNVSGERLMTSMEQSFVRQMRDAGFPASTAKKTFQLSRKYAQDNGFTLAGMNPEDFWKASKSELEDMVDVRVAKREVFSMLAKSAGGDMRLLGLSAGGTQRIRSGLIARGLDPNAYLGAVTVKTYNALRYALNPTFFIQAEFDAPWFNMYRGIMFDLRGKAPKFGSPTYEMEAITNAMGHSSVARDLQMDFTERVATIGWQEEVRNRLGSMPGVQDGIGARFKRWSGRMILNNELLYMNSKIGEVVFDALKTTRGILDDKIKNAVTDAERESWMAVRQDQVPMFDYLREEMTSTLGRVPTDEEIGRRYLSEIIDDSRLEVRTKEGLLDYQNVNSKGAYHVPTNVGELRSLNLDYGAESLGLPNIHSAADLRAAIGRDAVTIGDVRDTMKQLGYHRDHIQRFTTALMFNWREYFDGMSRTLNMSRYEMQAIEDMVAKTAKMQGMSPVDYLSQVLPMNVKKAGAAEYASTGRIVTPEEMQGLQARGAELLNVPGAKNPVDLQAAVDSVASELHQRTALTEWGGATYSPRTGQFIEDANPWMHHGTSASNEAGIAQRGIQSGTFTRDVTDRAIPRGDKFVLYRSRSFSGKFSPDKFAEWQRGTGIKPEALQISRDGGTTWEDVVKGSGAGDGPWVSGVGKTTSITIKQAQDPAKFKAALDKFVAANADELQKPGMYVGTFRDDKIGKVQFDVSRATFNVRDTEAVQAAAGRTGGAYNVATGNGLFAPQLSPMADTTSALEYALNVMRAAGKGEAGVQDVATLVAQHLQPSMKERLLEHFTERIAGRNGLIERAMKAGDTQAAQDLNLVLEDLRGGWGPAADTEFKNLVVRRAGGEAVGGFVPAAPAAPVFDRAAVDASGVPVVKPTELEQSTIQSWQYASNVNSALRSGASKADTKAFDAMFSRIAPTTKPLVLYRGIDPAEYASMRAQIGGTYEDLGYMATSADRAQAFDNFGLNHMVEVEVPAGSKVLPIDRISTKPLPSDEMVLPRGSHFSVREEGDRLILTLRDTPDLNVNPTRQARARIEDNLRALNKDRAEMQAEVDAREPAQGKAHYQDIVDRIDASIAKTQKELDAIPKQPPVNPGTIPPEFLAEPEVERAARYFSKWLQEVGPTVQAGEVLKGIAESIPVEGASAHNFTQSLLLGTLNQSIRLAEKDAIRLAHMSTERTVLERSLNHPMFAMYPSSYFWGKVVPETVRFLGYEPFGFRTTQGVASYYKVKQSIDMQSQYDPRMKDLWDKVGKSAVMSLISYLSPSLPYEDMKSNLPPWVRSMGKNGLDFEKMLQAEFDTFSPERWVSHFVDAGKEIGAGVESAATTLSGPQQQGLQTISQEPPQAAPATTPPSLTGPVKGTGLGPVLSGELSDLQNVLAGR